MLNKSLYYVKGNYLWKGHCGKVRKRGKGGKEGKEKSVYLSVN